MGVKQHGRIILSLLENKKEIATDYSLRFPHPDIGSGTGYENTSLSYSDLICAISGIYL